MKLDAGAAVLVVGGGLAGSLVAMRLQRAGMQVTLAAGPHQEAASSVAAGLFNTVTGRYPRRTWQADAYLAALEAFFAGLPQDVSVHLHKQLIYRPLLKPELFNDWAGQLAEASLEGKLRLRTEPWQGARVHNPYGGLEVLEAGWLAVGPFLQALQRQLQAEGVRVEARKLDYEALEPSVGRVQAGPYAGPYTAVVFAEGVGVNGNPFRPFRQLEALGGETITVQLNAEDAAWLDRIVVSGGYFLPVGEGRLVVGSTYVRGALEAKPTEAGRALLLDKLRAALPGLGPLEVVAHKAGLRPTTPDRKPLLGQHPSYPRLWFMNGLGTKGVLQSPLCSQLLVQAMLGKGGIPAAYDLGRKSLRV